MILQKKDNMTTDHKTKFAFPVGYLDFHKDPAFNFQMNRWYSVGYAGSDDLKEAGQKIHSFESAINKKVLYFLIIIANLKSTVKQLCPFPENASCNTLKLCIILLTSNRTFQVPSS